VIFSNATRLEVETYLNDLLLTWGDVTNFDKVEPEEAARRERNKQRVIRRGLKDLQARLDASKIKLKVYDDEDDWDD
jgi:hypothetical protein